MKKITSSKIIINILYAFLAQGISLLFSVLMTFVVSKFIGVEQFSFWQLFIFYTNYSAFFGIGICDGIYLRLGGKEYEELEYSLLGTQLRLFIVFEVVLAAVVIVTAGHFIGDSRRYFVLVAMAIYFVLYNMNIYIGYIFQAVNKTKIYSVSIIIDRVFYIAVILLLLVKKIEDFRLFILFFIISRGLSILYCFAKGREIVFAKGCSIKPVVKEMAVNFRVGIKIMFANIASLLIIGCGRFVIDHHWSIEAFGKFSFAISLTNFFLVFINQVSMVLFPALRKNEGKELAEFYARSRTGLGLLLPSVFLMYIPMNAVITLWLPQYAISAKYLVLLLPICLFDGKTQMICSTYLKVLRKEKILMQVNLLAMGISLGLSLVSAYIFNSIEFVAVSMVAAVAVRNIVADKYLEKELCLSMGKETLLELGLVAVFMLSTWYLDGMMAFCIYGMAYAGYCIYNKAIVGALLNKMKLKYIG